MPCIRINDARWRRNRVIVIFYETVSPGPLDNRRYHWFTLANADVGLCWDDARGGEGV